MTKIKELQEEIKKLVSKINETHKHPYPELISLMKAYEEMGEVTQVVLKNQIKSRKSDQLTKDDVKEELGNEIADSIIALISLANDYEIDLDEVIAPKFDIHNERN